MSTPIAMAVRKIHCFDTNDVIGSDEPYVLVAGIDLTVVPLPNVEVTLYGPWADVDSGEIHSTFPVPVFPPSVPPQLKQALLDFLTQTVPFLRTPFWALDNKSAKAIEKPTDVIILAAMMEHDDGTPQSLREAAKSAIVASLAASIGMPRDTLVTKLRNDMDAALDAFNVDAGFYSTDDHIGRTQELKLMPKDLDKARKGLHLMKLRFIGDSADYSVTFELAPSVPLP
jgi:hypothetical protein